MRAQGIMRSHEARLQHHVTVTEMRKWHLSETLSLGYHSQMHS